MSKLTPDRWRLLSPYLDQALPLEGPELAAWLASVRERDPTVASDLQTLLDEYRSLAEERFLEESLMPPRGDAPLIGQVIGAYKLTALIGEGGMGRVWLAERSDGRFERQAAVKFLNIALAPRGGEERLAREAMVLARLAHPNIAQLLDAGVTPAGQPYIILEHVDGEHIDHYCDDRMLDIESRVRLFIDVLAAVAHAHANLIVHRDIKPSNVLVSTDGQVKLLDFGIAKLVDDEGQSGAATALTRESGGAITPLYAAPEQVTGGSVSTATDVYASGVLLYVLLSGRHPSGFGPHSPADLIKTIVDTPPPRLSEVVMQTGMNGADMVRNRATTPDKLQRQLRGDLDTIVAKALKKNPQERYASVTALSDDLLRYLKREPIAARPDTLAYRASKFVQRNRSGVVMAALAFAGSVAGLLGTMIQANSAYREQAIAQRRFNEVRQLAGKLFDIDRQVRKLPGSAQTRQLIVDTSLEYLARLAADARTDADLALDLGTAYLRVARVQGVPISSNLGQADKAEQSLQMAESVIASVLVAQPENRIAHLRASQIAHDRMVLAQARRPDTEALPLARQSQHWLEKYLSAGKLDESENDQVVITGMNVANWYVRKDLIDDGLRLLRRTIAIASATNQPQQAGAAQIVLARALRGQGDLEGALAAIREGVTILQLQPGVKSPSRLLTFELALVTQGEILGEDDAVSLGRSREAAQYFERGFRIAADLVRQDSNDAHSRLALSTGGIRLAGVVRHWNPHRAIAIYQETLRRLAEVKNNSRARRDEVRALAELTYPLRQIGRSADARQRLEAAFSRMRDLKLYPAEDIKPRSEPVDALRALAELEAELGKVQRGIEIYQELAGKIRTSSPKPDASLDAATDLSSIYRAMARLHRRAGSADLASAVESQRLELWREWERKLPDNAFVLRQIAKARRE